MKWREGIRHMERERSGIPQSPYLKEIKASPYFNIQFLRMGKKGKCDIKAVRFEKRKYP